MFVKFLLCLSFCFLYKPASFTSAFEERFDGFSDLVQKQESFRLVENMINEARAIIMGILRGDLSDDIKKEMESKNVDFNGSYDGVSKLVKKCLRNAKNKAERKEIVKKCFERAVRERQNEEAQGEEEIPTVQSCVQDAMLEASQSAAPLMMEAQEHAALFREMMQKTASNFARCRGQEAPFQCMMVAWAEAQQNITFMRDQVIDMMLIARDIYVQYMDDVRKCITPVEGIEEEEETEAEVEEVTEEEKKKEPSATAFPKVTPSYYDPVEENRKNTFLKYPSL